jgi:hypothetical protein
MSLPATLTNNKTLSILREAEAGGYGVCAPSLRLAPLGALRSMPAEGRLRLTASTFDSSAASP